MSPVKLNRLHTTLRRDFRDLPLPESIDHLEGAYTAKHVGPTPVRLAGPLVLGLLGFRGWKGKRFAMVGDELKGKNRFRSGEPKDDRVPMNARIAPSIIDGRDAFVVTYPADTSFPWRFVRDEFREFEEGKLLGITTFRIPMIKHLPIAFVLERDSTLIQSATPR